MSATAPKLLALLLTAVLLVLTACSDNTAPGSEAQSGSETPSAQSETTDEPFSSEQSLTYEIGQVSVISGNAEFEPYEHMSSAGVIVDGQMVDGVGMYLSLEEVSKSLPEIEYADDFQVIVEGEDTESTAYSLYNDKFENLYLYQKDLSIPTDAGTYSLLVAVTWSNGSADPQYKEYTLNEYLFKVKVSSALPQFPEKHNEQSVTFPASDKGKTEFNAAIYEIAPFSMDVILPTGWRLTEREIAADFDTDIALSGVWSVLDMYNADNERVGAVGYNTYEPTEGAEDLPQAIYSQIALGNDYHFDVRDSYYVINESDSGVTATADVYYSGVINNGSEKINRGIVSYDKNLLVYIAMELSGDKVTDAEIESIANSIRLAEIAQG
jgi:hypothetical protein